MGLLGRQVADRYKRIFDESADEGLFAGDKDQDRSTHNDHDHDHDEQGNCLFDSNDEEINSELEALKSEWDEEAANLDPAYSLWFRVLDMVDMIYGSVADFEEMRTVRRSINTLTRRYKPDSQYSPMTESYFTLATWTDHRFGDDQESVLDIVREVVASTDGDAHFLAMLDILGRSRASFFEVLGRSMRKGLTRVRSIVTGAEFEVMIEPTVPARKGTIWYTRLLPSCLEGEEYHIAISLPYLIRGVNRAKLVDALRDNAIFSDEKWRQGEQVTQEYLKYGNGRTYWFDYIMASAELAELGAETVELCGAPPPPARCRSRPRRKSPEVRNTTNGAPVPVVGDDSPANARAAKLIASNPSLPNRLRTRDARSKPDGTRYRTEGQPVRRQGASARSKALRLVAPPDPRRGKLSLVPVVSSSASDGNGDGDLPPQGPNGKKTLPNNVISLFKR